MKTHRNEVKKENYLRIVNTDPDWNPIYFKKAILTDLHNKFNGYHCTVVSGGSYSLVDPINCEKKFAGEDNFSVGIDRKQKKVIKRYRYGVYNDRGQLYFENEKSVLVKQNQHYYYDPLNLESKIKKVIPEIEMIKLINYVCGE
jgi:hypothetical protein